MHPLPPYYGLFKDPLVDKLCNDNLEPFGIEEKLGFEIFQRIDEGVVCAENLSKNFFEHYLAWELQKTFH